MQKLRKVLWIAIKRLGAYLIRSWVWLHDRKHRKSLVTEPDLSAEDLNEVPDMALGNNPPEPAFEHNMKQPTQILDQIGAELGRTPAPPIEEIANVQDKSPDTGESNPLIDLLPELEKLVATPILPGEESTMEQQDTPLTDQEQEITIGPQDTPPTSLEDDLMNLFTEDLIGNEDLRNLVRTLEEVEVHDLSNQCKDLAAKLKLHKQR